MFYTYDIFRSILNHNWPSQVNVACIYWMSLNLESLLYVQIDVISAWLYIFYWYILFIYFIYNIYFIDIYFLEMIASFLLTIFDAFWRHNLISILVIFLVELSPLLLKYLLNFFTVINLLKFIYLDWFKSEKYFLINSFLILLLIIIVTGTKCGGQIRASNGAISLFLILLRPWFFGVKLFVCI